MTNTCETSGCDRNATTLAHYENPEEEVAFCDAHAMREYSTGHAHTLTEYDPDEANDD